MKGRTIKIFLVEGTPNDIMTAEIVAAWTGMVIIAPRTNLVGLAKRPEVQRAGVYILVGDDPDFPAKEQVYIGESEDVLNRLKQHNKDEKKDFWNHTIIVVSKDEHLTKSLVRFLESRLIQVVGQARRATLCNGSAPDPPKLPESDVADMEYFLAQVQMLLPVLGYSFILPAPAVVAQTAAPATGQAPLMAPQISEDPPLFQMKVAEVEARAQEIGGEFVVLKNSAARSNHAPALGRGYLELREQLFAEGKLVSSQNGLWVFAENVPFSSPSAAGAVVAGTNLNGRVVWRHTQTKQTYKEWKEAQLGSSNSNIDEEAGEQPDDEGNTQLEGEAVLEIGSEGGSVTIYRRQAQEGWVFWSEGSSIKMDQDEGDSSGAWRQAETNEITELLPERWVMLYPLRVHAVIVPRLREAYTKQVEALLSEEKEMHDMHLRGRWNRFLQLDVAEKGEMAAE